MPNPNIKPDDVLGMSDDEFMADLPVFNPDETIQPETDPTVSTTNTNEDDTTTPDNEGGGTEQTQSTEVDPLTNEDDVSDPSKVVEPDNGDEVVDPTKVEKKPEPKNSDDKSKDKVVEKQPENKPAETEVDYKAAYEKIMAPFKANGKMIDVRDPEEAISLMKMGANYTKKMQSIQEHKKLLMMLENNQLLDESKLSYLIDLSKNNPDAIKKLVKDAGIDPMDIDTTADSTYVQGNHRVSDEESVFVEQLEELRSTQEGKQTLHVINTEWDQASKEKLWDDPKVMTMIHQHRESGMYARISSEIEHQRTLGKIPANVSFIDAYQVIGNYLHEKGAFADLSGQPAKQPIDRKVATPKPKVSNDSKVSAAATSRSTPNKATAVINPFAESDEEFMKKFANRV